MISMLTITAARPDAAKLAVSGLFGKYKPEEEKQVRKVQVTEDKVLKQLKAAWKKIKVNITSAPEETYKNALKQIKRLVYSAKDVENFSIVIAEFQNEKYFREKAGLFLSALINNCKDSDYVVHTKQLDREIDYLGHENTKSITVGGDVGDFIGYEMKGGSITVNGNAAGWVGALMGGGSITVNGDAGQSLGREMVGGSITVNGNAEPGVGDVMFGGEIHLNGKHKGLGNRSWGGKIYHKGKLISDSHDRSYC